MEELDFKIGGTVVFTGNIIEHQFNIDYKYNAKGRAKAEKILNDSKKSWSEFPDSPEKRQALTELRDAEEQIKMTTAGNRCSFLQKSFYYVRGATIYTNELVNATTCNNTADIVESIPLEKSTDVVEGDKLVVTSGREVEKGSICPVGDREVMNFTRNK